MSRVTVEVVMGLYGVSRATAEGWLVEAPVDRRVRRSFRGLQALADLRQKQGAATDLATDRVRDILGISFERLARLRAGSLNDAVVLTRYAALLRWFYGAPDAAAAVEAQLAALTAGMPAVVASGDVDIREVVAAQQLARAQRVAAQRARYAAMVAGSRIQVRRGVL